MNQDQPVLELTTDTHHIKIFKTEDHQFELYLYKDQELTSTLVYSCIYELINDPMFKEEEFKSLTKEILTLTQESN